MVYSVKNIKSFTGREGLGFECTLYKDGKKIGTVTDTANGGEVDFYLDKGEEDKLRAYCKTLPRTYYDDVKNTTSLTKKQFEKFWKEGREIHAGDFVTALVEKWENDKRQKAQRRRWCKRETVFRIEGDKKGNYRTISQPYDIKIKAHLMQKYKGQGLVIVNEEFVK